MRTQATPGTALKIELEGEEASLFAQLLLELHNYNYHPDLASPLHIGLVMLNKLERDGELDVREVARHSERSASYGYEDSYKKIRGWLAGLPDPEGTWTDLWRRFKAEHKVRERGAETCEATSSAGRGYFCLLEPGHGGEHRWGWSR